MVNNSTYIAYRFPLVKSNLNAFTYFSDITSKTEKNTTNKGYQSSFANTVAEMKAHLRKTDLSIETQMQAFSIKWLSEQSTISKESVPLHWKTVEP